MGCPTCAPFGGYGFVHVRGDIPFPCSCQIPDPGEMDAIREVKSTIVAPKKRGRKAGSRCGATDEKDSDDGASSLPP